MWREVVQVYKYWAYAVHACKCGDTDSVNEESWNSVGLLDKVVSLTTAMLADGGRPDTPPLILSVAPLRISESITRTLTVRSTFHARDHASRCLVWTFSFQGWWAHNFGLLDGSLVRGKWGIESVALPGYNRPHLGTVQCHENIQNDV